MEELEYLKNRSLLIVEYLLSKHPGNPMMEHFRTIIGQTYDKKNVKGLKALSRDMNAWAKGVPQKDIKELETLLAEKFAENLSGDKITHTIIKRVLKKGKIEGEENYRVVYEYLQDISDTDPFFSKLPELESLLAAYQN